MDVVKFCRQWDVEIPFGIPGTIHMDEASLHVLGETEDHHFWAQTKVRIVHSLLQKFIQKDRRASLDLLDMGCGNGSFIQFISERWPGIRCTGMDGYPGALRLARERVPHARLLLHDLLHMNMWQTEEKYDVVTALDVIEHLDDPISFLRSLRTRIAPRGICIVSVPAFPCLWSERDAFLSHRKRYTKKVLLMEMHEAGYEVLRCNYAFSFMFLPAFFVRKFVFPFLRLSGARMEASELHVVPVLNGIIRMLGTFEAWLHPKIRIPFGTSVFCVARVCE